MKVRTQFARNGRAGEGLSRAGRAVMVLQACLALVVAQVDPPPAGTAVVEQGTVAAAPFVVVEALPSRVAYDAGAAVLTWRALPPGALLMPRFVPVAGDTPPVDAPLVRVAGDGVARMSVPITVLRVVGALHVTAVVATGVAPEAGAANSAPVADSNGSAAGRSGGGRGGFGLCTVWPPASVAGWVVSAQNTAYESDHLTLAVGASVDTTGPQATSLWIAVNDESSSSLDNVKVVEFEPASLQSGYDNVLLECDHTLASGHTLCARIFDHEPTTAELGTGDLLWDSD
ncbi:MAG: hypothetical protein R3F56_05400 [Planctomycetota bacterium]